MSGVSHSKRNISISTAGRDCHGAETDKRNKPQSMWGWKRMGINEQVSGFPANTELTQVACFVCALRTSLPYKKKSWNDLKRFSTESNPMLWCAIFHQTKWKRTQKNVHFELTSCQLIVTQRICTALNGKPLSFPRGFAQPHLVFFQRWNDIQLQPYVMLSFGKQGGYKWLETVAEEKNEGAL